MHFLNSRQCQSMSSTACFYFTLSLRVAIGPVATDDVIVDVLRLFLLLFSFSSISEIGKRKQQQLSKERHFLLWYVD
jgi:hypothetical protein